MPYILLEAHLPGVTGLLEYRKDTGAPLRELTQLLLRGPSTLTEAERELIAAVVSHRNECVISQGVLNAYIPALFPTSVRSSATGFCFNIGRIFTAAAVFFVGWLVQILGGYGNAITVFSFTLLIGFLFTLGVRERVLFR